MRAKTRVKSGCVYSYFGGSYIGIPHEGGDP